jgi:hypothetical protein
MNRAIPDATACREALSGLTELDLAKRLLFEELNINRFVDSTADRDSAAAFPAPPLIRSRQTREGPKVCRLPLEGAGSEPSVPRLR